MDLRNDIGTIPLPKHGGTGDFEDTFQVQEGELIKYIEVRSG